MKIMKKIAAAVLASAALFAFVGCSSDESGEGETEGTKNNTTMIVDGTNSASKPLEKEYRRYWKQLGSGEKVAEITTEITVDLEKSVLTSGTASVVGYVFDLNENATDKAKRDVCVLGFNPQTKKAYVEHYSSIAELKDEDTNEKSLGESDNNIFGNGSWGGVVSGTNFTEDTAGKKITFTVQLVQTTKGTYDIYMYAPGKSADSSTKLGSYAGQRKGESGATKDFAIGGVGVYGNVGKGNKIVATYVTDKDSVTGSFMDEVVEE